MNIGRFSPTIEKEINDKGYHVLNQSLPSNSYPNTFPPHINPDKIHDGKIYAIRLFFNVSTGVIPRIDSGLISIKIISHTEDKFVAEILTLLPIDFPLSKGQHIILTRDEILFEQS